MCKFYHSLLILRKNFENSDRSMYAICVINFVHNLRCLLKNLRSQQKFYATAGCTGCDKYELCLTFLHIGQFTPQKYYGHLSLTKWCKNKKGLFCLLRDNAMFEWDWLGPEMINLCKRCVEESQLHGTSNTKVGEQSTHQLAARNHCWFTDRGQPGMCLALSGQKEIHQNQ